MKKASAKAHKRAMVLVEYIGPLTRVSVPGQFKRYIKKGEHVEVRADLLLNAHWRVVEEVKPEAPTKDGE